jgi:hypothetical protein
MTVPVRHRPRQLHACTQSCWKRRKHSRLRIHPLSHGKVCLFICLPITYQTAFRLVVEQYTESSGCSATCPAARQLAVGHVWLFETDVILPWQPGHWRWQTAINCVRFSLPCCTSCGGQSQGAAGEVGIEADSCHTFIRRALYHWTSGKYRSNPSLI